MFQIIDSITRGYVSGYFGNRFVAEEECEILSIQLGRKLEVEFIDYEFWDKN
jgi:hypothetical protein